MGNQCKDKIICPECGSKLGEVMINVAGATNKILSWQCPAKDCIYIKYDEVSGDKVVAELKSQFYAGQKMRKLQHKKSNAHLGKETLISAGLKAEKR